MINEIVLRRRNKITVNTAICKADSVDYRYVVTLMKNIESLGYTFDDEAFKMIAEMDKKTVTSFGKELIAKLKVLSGADREYNPMYPNFPKQVIEADDIELFVNAIIHYWSCGQILPEYEKEERFPMIDNPTLTKLGVGTIDDVWEIFGNLLGSKTSLSTNDKEDVEWIMENYHCYSKHLPDEIPLRENVAMLANLILLDKNTDNSVMAKYFKTATDVLRLVTSMSDGDISLAENTKFKKLKRSERRLVMDLLAGCKGNILEDMYRYRERWIRIGEIVHPKEFHAVKYYKVVNAFDNLRKGDKPLFFGGKVADAINNGDIDSAITLLSERPGEFARHLDKLLRDAKHKKYVVHAFSSVADQVSIPILLNLIKHFKHRNDEDRVRVVMPKGLVAKAYTIENQEKPIPESVCNGVVYVCEQAIIRQCYSKDNMGKVYIDPEFKNYVMPFSQRSASKSVSKMLTRGSRIKIDDNANVIRGFIWWTNMGEQRERYGYDVSTVDIDLSVAFFDENWKYKTHVSWTNIRDREFKCYHSGDIVNGGSPKGKGAAEFIDINIPSCKNARYAVFNVYSFRGQKFSEMPNVRFGWMEREDMNSGEIFEPSTVEMAIDLTSESTQSIPVVFDLWTKEFVWCDLVNSNNRFGGMIENSMNGIVAACYSAVNMDKPSLYDAIVLNTMARGVLVDNIKDADIAFTNEVFDVNAYFDYETYINEDGEFVSELKDIERHTSYELDYYMNDML